MRRAFLLALVAFALIALAAPAARALTTIDTTGTWDGSEVCSFGSPDTATYGQVITVPARDTVLDRFSFYFSAPAVGTTVVFRGEVYAWDGAKATGGALWESPARTLTPPRSRAFEEVTFETGGIPLVAGGQYVLFASISKDYEQNTGFTCWGFINQADAYPDGGFVFENNAGDESQWTSRAWETFADRAADLAFKASFSAPLPTSKSQCKAGGWQTFGVFKNQGDCVSFVASGGKNPLAAASRASGLLDSTTPGM